MVLFYIILRRENLSIHNYLGIMNHNCLATLQKIEVPNCLIGATLSNHIIQIIGSCYVHLAFFLTGPFK